MIVRCHRYAINNTIARSIQEGIKLIRNLVSFYWFPGSYMCITSAGDAIFSEQYIANGQLVLLHGMFCIAN